MRSRATVQSPRGFLNARNSTTREAVRLALQDGAYLFRIHPAETAAGLEADDLVFGFPVLCANRYGDNEEPGTTDMTAAVAAAIAVALELGGGQVTFLAERYGITGAELGTGVYLVGQNVGEAAGGQSELVALAGAGGDFISCPGDAIFHCGIVGLKLTGLGDATALIGVHLDNVAWGTVRWCFLDQFADNGIKLDADTIACHVESNLAINCLLNRTRAAQEGVLDVDGTDHRIIGGEYTASLSALTDANRRVGAVVIRGAENFVDMVVGEISDFGIATIGATGENRLHNCRADLNFGHGYEINGNTLLSICRAVNNSRETTNTYDGFYVTNNGNVTGVGCKAYSSGAPVHRYGFNDLQQSASSKNIWDKTCRSVGHGTRGWNISSNFGACHESMTGMPSPVADGDATPSVDDYGSYITGNTNPTNITTFDNGYEGQVIEVFAGDANTTFVHGSGIVTLTGANVAATVARWYRFKLFGGNWYQL